MKLSEVAEIYKRIKRHYPHFDASVENVMHAEKYLRDIAFPAAAHNLDRHILTERFPPTIADLRGKTGNQSESGKGKEEAEAYFAQVELWKKTAVPPPAGIKKRLSEKLGGLKHHDADE